MLIGILGGGQLGRMMALAAYPLGIRCRFLDPAADSPAGQVGELIVGGYDDPAALARFARGLDRVTFEFENVPEASLAYFKQAGVPVAPGPECLRTGQDRLAEKQLFARLKIPTAPYAPADSLESLRRAVGEVGLPCVVKTRRMGYDGKGQAVLRSPQDIDAAWARLADPALKVGLIVEAFVRFDREVSIVAARSASGEHAFYPLTENVHAIEPAAGGGILRLSRAPAPGATPEVERAARAYATSVLDALDYAGVLAIEFFLASGTDGRASLIANETAPRVHNSGHWTMDACAASQFENHIRAVAGLPLGLTALHGCAAMLNLIGDTPPIAKLLSVPGARVHLYGKEPRPGRKLGHVNLVGPSWDAIDPALRELTELIAPSA
jgi:5-(carboxyamino)imidazole ribonucleotide synthase